MSIALDTSLKVVESTGTTSTTAYTCTGSNRALVVALHYTGSTAPTSITYNGVALTAGDQSVTGSSAESAQIYYLLNPASGTNNIVVTFAGSTTYGFTASSYIGVYQAAIDAHSHAENNSTTSFSIPITTIGDTCWLVAAVASSSSTWTAGTNTTLRGSNSDGSGLVDSNGGITPPGATSLAVSNSGNAAFRASIISLYAAFPSSFSASDTQGSSDSTPVMVVGAVINASDTQGSTDTATMRHGWQNNSKNNSSWTNTQKS